MAGTQTKPLGGLLVLSMEQAVAAPYCLLAAPEGIARFTAAHPDVPVFTAAIDERLNELGYIVPGLGDAGDRIYGTK